jgi:hypothetical protein
MLSLGRCVNCGFLQQNPGFFAVKVGTPSPGPRPISLPDRRTIRKQTYEGTSRLACHHALLDLEAGAVARLDEDEWGHVSTEELIPTHFRNLNRLRRCSEYYEFRPGNSPAKHVELRDRGRETVWARWWDVGKIALTVGLAAIGAALGPTLRDWAMSWWQFLQSAFNHPGS